MLYRVLGRCWIRSCARPPVILECNAAQALVWWFIAGTCLHHDPPTLHTLAATTFWAHLCQRLWPAL